MVSKTGFLVLGWRALVPEISTSDSSLFFATNEKLKYQESILGLQRWFFLVRGCMAPCG
ncbi:hypothetical protein YC2023_103938 [Brassica napus]